MTLVGMPALLERARAGSYAVGYFEAWDQYSMEAVIEAAEAERSPVIIGTGGMVVDQSWFDRSGLETLASVGRALAERSPVPMALILNEVHTLEQIRRGLSAGYNVVMLDTSSLSYEQNVRVTAEVVALAGRFGAAVESELGQLPDATTGTPESAHGGALTDPQQAAAFVAATGIDALAVSIGNVHMLVHGTMAVQLDHLARIHAAVTVPLSIHGGSGFPPEAVRGAIALGAIKFNVGTAMKVAYLDATRNYLQQCTSTDYQQLVGSRSPVDFMMAGKHAVRDVVAGFMRLYGSSGQA
jgi:ketose-bisphosphate aldolase